MSKNNGGPAFARPKSPNGEYTDSDVPCAQTGMSLRDYFAAKALQGMSANPYYDDYEFDVVADMAYGQADAMLYARSA